ERDSHDAQLYYQRSLALRQLGRLAEADADLAHNAELKAAVAELARLNDEASRRPTDADVRHQVGRLWDRLGKPELAATWYQAALACDPAHEGARHGLAEISPSAPGRTHSRLP